MGSSETRETVLGKEIVDVILKSGTKVNRAGPPRSF